MTCPVTGRLELGGVGIALDCAPIAPVHWLVAAAALAGFAAVVAIAVSDRRQALGRRPLWRGLVIGASGLAALLLASAGQNPLLIRQADESGRFLAILVDTSDSTARGRLGEAAAAMAQWVRAVSARLDRDDRRGTGALLAVAEGTVEMAGAASLDRLAGTLDGLDRVGGPPGGATDLATGLAEAAALVAASGRAGAVLLLSDGLETRGDAEAAAEALGRQGIPVFPFPLDSPAPAFGLLAADLPARVESGTETTVRAVLANPGDQPAGFRLAWDRNQAPLPGAGTTRRIEPNRMVAWRHPTRFAGRGLQFGTLRLTTEDGRAQVRRLFTLVASPIRLLAIGPAGWARALPSGRFAVTAMEPGGPAEPEGYDVVAINGVPAGDLGPSMFARLEAAVRGGTGLLVINGGHPYPETEPSVVISYGPTPLGPLLPVTGEPRLVADEPPPREVILVVDSSGSMGGWKLAMARRIGRAVIDRLDRRDTARILTFQTGVREILPPTAMDPAGRTRARALLDRIVAGGGTDPGDALRLVGRTAGASCGMFFISDGDFGGGWRPPGCLTTVFAVGQSRQGVNPDLFALGDVHPVGRDFAPGMIRLAFFEPDMRETYFERGRYVPEAVGSPLPEVPGAGLEGSAVVYARGDARILAVRPWPFVPVLTFREDETARIGVLGTAVPDDWPDQPHAAEAIEAWIERLVAWPARDRYLFDIRDRGMALEVRIVLAAAVAGGGPVDDIAARIRLEDGTWLPLPLDPDPHLWGAFQGRLSLPAGETARRGILELREQGPGAMPGAQRIPIRLPGRLASASQVPMAEDWTYGQDRALLRRIAQLSGGALAPSPESFAEMAAPSESPGRPLFPWLLAAAGVSYALAIAVQRFAA